MPPEAIEARRRQALALLDQGLSINEVGRRIGCAPSSVMRWRNRRTQDGEGGLKVRFSTGRPHKLTTANRKRLVRLLALGTRRAGFTSDGWTMALVVILIEREFGVVYYPSHISRLLSSLGWVHRDPEGWRAVDSLPA
jgi:transposase